MNPDPHGRLVPTPDGVDLVLTRTFPAPVAEVWASITEPERTARWFGRWEGQPGTGRTVRLQMTFEDDASWSEVHIDACDPPHHLAVTSGGAGGPFRLRLDLQESDGVTTLTFVHRLADGSGVADFGPGWEYYLDRLVAAREQRPALDWAAYAGQREHYARLAEALPGYPGEE